MCASSHHSSIFHFYQMENYFLHFILWLKTNFQTTYWIPSFSTHSESVLMIKCDDWWKIEFYAYRICFFPDVLKTPYQLSWDLKNYGNFPSTQKVISWYWWKLTWLKLIRKAILNSDRGLKETQITKLISSMRLLHEKFHLFFRQRYRIIALHNIFHISIFIIIFIIFPTS